MSARIPADDLSALVSSRICHDLINPMGAISNGIELLETVSKNLGPELQLVSDSLASATARLNFFRIAFGQADAGAELKTAHFDKMVREMFAGRRFDVEVVSTSFAAPRQTARTLLLVLLCMESAMPMGGTLRVEEQHDGSWLVAGQGRRIVIKAPLWEPLQGPGPLPEIAPGDVHFAVAAYALHDYGLKLAMEATDGALSVLVAQSQRIAATA